MTYDVLLICLCEVSGPGTRCDQILRNWQLDNQEPTLAFVTGFLNTGKY